MHRSKLRLGVFAGLALALAAGAAQATPFATRIVSFTQGTNPAPGFDDPSVALGIPALDTGFGDVTPFNSPFLTSQIVSIGAGGELIVTFAEPVNNDPLNPFGIDLLIFGNSFFFDPSFQPIATDILAEPGAISVSQDGDVWFDITGVTADGLSPPWLFSIPRVLSRAMAQPWSTSRNPWIRQSTGWAGLSTSSWRSTPARAAVPASISARRDWLGFSSSASHKVSMTHSRPRSTRLRT